MNHPKQFVNDFASIDLIIGPMYGGKTTELLRRLIVCKEMGLRCCYINSSSDNRTTTAFSTHNKLLAKEINATGNILGDTSDFIAAFKTNDICELLSMIDNYDVFAIDEAQLFTNLLATVTQLADVHHKRIIVAGLNGTSERRMFGEILYLIPHANTIQKLEPFCKLCANKSKITPAIFTKCTVSKSSTVLIGAHDSYVAVCRECYNSSNKVDALVTEFGITIPNNSQNKDNIFTDCTGFNTVTIKSSEIENEPLYQSIPTSGSSTNDSATTSDSTTTSDPRKPLLPNVPTCCSDGTDLTSSTVSNGSDDSESIA
jgi:thymidine kinase